MKGIYLNLKINLNANKGLEKVYDEIKKFIYNNYEDVDIDLIDDAEYE